MSNGPDVLTAVDTESVLSAVRRGLRANRLLAIGLLMALAIVVVALFAPLLAPSRLPERDPSTPDVARARPRPTGSGPTSWGATCTRGCSSAPGSRR